MAGADAPVGLLRNVGDGHPGGVADVPGAQQEEPTMKKRYITFDIIIKDDYILPVFVWRNRKLFRTGTLGPKDACFFGIESTARHPLIGSVHFIRGEIGSGIVSHEMCHAAHHAVRIWKLKDREEERCAITQALVAGFWRAAYDIPEAKKWIIKE
jgi:hypothetical protein